MTEKDLHKLRRQDLLQLLLSQSKNVAQRQTELETVSARLTKQTETVERLKKRLNEKDAQIEHLKERLNEKDRQMERLKGRPVDDEQLERLKGRLNKKDEQLERLQTQMDEKDEMIRELQELLKIKKDAKTLNFDELLEVGYRAAKEYLEEKKGGKGKSEDIEWLF